MAITIVGTETHTTYTTRTNTTITAPTGLANGDVVVIGICTGAAGGSGTAPDTTLTGFTLLTGYPSQAFDGGFNVEMRIYYKIASGEGANWTATHTNCSSVGWAMAFRGVDQTTPIDVNPSLNTRNSAAGPATPSTALSITTATNGAMVIWAGHDWADTANALTAPAGTTPTFAEQIDTGTSSGLIYVATGILATAGATGDKTQTNNTTGGGSWSASLIALRPDTGAPAPQTSPQYKDVGTPQESITTVTPAWPTHAVGDVALLLAESTGGQPAVLTDAQGFQAVTNSPVATGTTTNGTQITAWWHRATSTSMAAPTIGDPGNHVYAVIMTFDDCITIGEPWDVTAADVKATASTSMTMPAVVTTRPNTLIVNTAARDNDAATAAASAEANASLTNLTERFDLGTALGNGGGIMVWTGELATPGSSGTTTATVVSSINAYLTIALAPPLSLPASLTRYIYKPAVRRAANW